MWTLAWWLLAWTRFAWFAPWQKYTFFPLWLGDMPALLKGFFEQVRRVAGTMQQGMESLKGRYPELVTWSRAMHDRGALICSACSGLFPIAETGLPCVVHPYAQSLMDYLSQQEFDAGAPRDIRTFSKVYGLAGLRVGYALCSPKFRAAVEQIGARALTGTTLLVDGGQHLMSLPRDVMFIAK